MAYQSGKVVLSPAAVKVLESSEYPRKVELSAGNSSVEVGYSDTTTAPLFQNTLSSRSLCLPPGYELWALSNAGSPVLGYLTTS